MNVDTVFGLETPAGTVIELQPAGIYARSLAFLVDELLRWTIIFATFSVTAFLGVFGQGLAMIVFFFTYWLYGVAFEVLNNGVTPGKRLRGLQVVHDDGTPVRLPASLLRNLLLWVDLLPILYVTGMVSMVLSSRFQRLGDLAAGTLVIYRPRQQVALAEARDVPQVPTAVALSQDEQSVLIDFLERADGLTAERAAELAALVGKTLGLGATEPAEDLKRLASGLRGG